MEYGEEGGFKVDATKQRVVKQSDILIPGLPNSIAVLCIAQVPRAYHRSMIGVSRIWRDHICSTVFLEMRRELSLVEDWLYVWTRIGNNTNRSRWHCFDPSSKKWAKLPRMPHDKRLAGQSGVASVDGKIFIIGGILLSSYRVDKSFVPCKTVSFFDTRSYCWKKIADLNIARAKCATGIIENQLYVFGGYMGHGDWTTTAETYDPVTDTWRLISCMEFPVTIHDSVVMGGKFYAINSNTSDPFGYDLDVPKERVNEIKDGLVGVVYDAKMDKWDKMGDGLNRGWTTKAIVLNGKLCTMDNVYKPLVRKHIQVYNSSKDAWDTVDGTWDTIDGDSQEDWDAYWLDDDQFEDWDELCYRETVMENVELANLGGKLCIVSTEVHGMVAGSEPDSDDDCGQEDVVTLRIVEITVSDGDHTDYEGTESDGDHKYSEGTESDGDHTYSEVTEFDGHHTISEVTTSDGDHYFSLEFKDDITEKIRYPNPKKATRPAATSCQVVGL